MCVCVCVCVCVCGLLGVLGIRVNTDDTGGDVRGEPLYISSESVCVCV